MGVSPRKGMGQEGRLWLSKRPQLYLYYIFSSPGLFQREERTVFRCPICFALCLLFPYTVSDNVFVSGAMSTRGLHVRNVFATERYIQSVVERGKSERSQDNCFASPVFQWDPHLGRNSQKTMVRGPWNNCAMKAVVPTQWETSSPSVESSLCFLFSYDCMCSLAQVANNDR